jgi:hypothetical protein
LATLTRTPTRRIRRPLREDLARGQAPLPAGQSRVTREDGGRIIRIRGCKVLGRKSPNKHGLREATNGTEYTLECMKRAAPLYEGIRVNANHPDRQAPGKDRQIEDRLGKLVNVRVTEGGMYGDLLVLATHPMAESLAAAAEAMPGAYALSHNSYGKGTVENGTYVVTEIPEVKSVDVVADGGTNRGLFEGRERRPMRSMRKWLRRLLEDDEITDNPAPGYHLGPAGGDDSGGDSELHDRIGDLILSVMRSVKAGQLTPEEGKKKILTAYEMATDDAGEEGPGDEEESMVEEALRRCRRGGRGRHGRSVRNLREASRGRLTLHTLRRSLTGGATARPLYESQSRRSSSRGALSLKTLRKALTGR